MSAMQPAFQPDPSAPALLGPEEGMFVASADALFKFALLAREGARCVYARASRLPRNAEVAEKARALESGGMVRLNVVRHARGSDLFDYLARRTDQPLCCEETARDDDALPPEERMLLDHLSRRADQGAPCDSNRALARAVGLRDGDQAAYRLRRLRDRGLIRVDAVPVEPGRVVTIISTHAKTGTIRR